MNRIICVCNWIIYSLLLFIWPAIVFTFLRHQLKYILIFFIVIPLNYEYKFFKLPIKPTVMTLKTFMTALHP
ncbi:MAG: hypothetical protein DRO01_03840 [Thermoproteota archaeon]|nr:MAG: hypothetical protein DRO01_03840 [Candidatus Korarchaeota archaeon]